MDKKLLIVLAQIEKQAAVYEDVYEKNKNLIEVFSKYLYAVCYEFSLFNLKSSFDDYKTIIEKYVADTNSQIPGANLQSEQVLAYFKDKIENLIKAQNIANNAYQISNNKNQEWFFYVFKNIRDLLITDVKITGKKEVESYFPTYDYFFKFFSDTKNSIKNIALIVEYCQASMLYLHSPPTQDKVVGKFNQQLTDTVKKILDDPKLEIEPALKPRQINFRKLDLQSNEGNLLYSSAFHTLHSGATFIAPKVISSNEYLETGKFRELDAERLTYLNKLFNDLDISFADKNDLSNKCLKLNMYEELTDDRQISSCFKHIIFKLKDIAIKIDYTALFDEELKNKIGELKVEGKESILIQDSKGTRYMNLEARKNMLQEVISNLEKQNKSSDNIRKIMKYNEYISQCDLLMENKNQEFEQKNDEKLDKMREYPSFKLLVSQKEKLKLLLKLKFDQKTITNLRTYILVIAPDGSVKLMQRPNTKPVLIDLNKIKNIVQQPPQAITASKKYNYLLQSLSAEIDNLLFKMI